MCLVIDDDKPNAQVSDTDITVYKVITITDDHIPMAMTYPFPYTFGVPAERVGLEPDTVSLRTGKPFNIPDDTFIPVINEGYHSFANLEDATVVFCNMNELYLPSPQQLASLALVRCTIPKGTEFYTGRHVGYVTVPESAGMSNYASTSITINKILEKVALYPPLDRMHWDHTCYSTTPPTVDSQE